MGVDLSKWGWTKWIGMPVDLRRRPFGLVFSLRNFKNICRQVGVSLLASRTPGICVPNGGVAVQRLQGDSPWRRSDVLAGHMKTSKEV